MFNPTITRTGEAIMSLVKVGDRHQVTIPIDIFKKFSLNPGDLLEIKEQGDTIVMVPSQVIPKDQAWFHTKEWQAKEAEAEKDIAQGRVSKVYDNIDEMLKDLDS